MNPEPAPLSPTLLKKVRLKMLISIFRLRAQYNIFLNTTILLDSCHCKPRADFFPDFKFSVRANNINMIVIAFSDSNATRLHHFQNQTVSGSFFHMDCCQKGDDL